MARLDVKEATIGTDIRRKLINGFGGAVENQGNAEELGCNMKMVIIIGIRELSGKTNNGLLKGWDFKR